MIASVLMPSRERVEMATESIRTLGEGDFEVLLYVDEDDSELEGYKAMESDRVHVFIQPRLTYLKFEEMVNYLAERAKGDWLYLWNDDAYLREGDWLTKFAEYDHKKVVVLSPGYEFEGTKLNLFPAISRKMYELQGFFSKSPHCDSWAQDVGNALKCQYKVDGIVIEHIRDDNSLHDATKAHTMASYAITVPKHGTTEVQQQMRDAIERLKGDV